MKLMLKHKVIGLPVVAAVLPVLVILVLTFVEKKSVTEKIEGELDLLARENIEHLALAVHNTCEATSKMVQKYLDGRLQESAAFFLNECQYQYHQNRQHRCHHRKSDHFVFQH